MENRPAETNSEVDKSSSPSVAQLAGKFKEQAANTTGKEVPPHKPTRRKPPCSLPLYSHKTETSDNDEQKRSPNACPVPKVKVKSSPMIEKLQANLAFAPAALLPGASPKSPGLKALVSPFSTPPSTPSSPGVQSQPSEASETPVSFDQPPEGTQLQFYNKVRTRGSIKRRPPSRKFRRSLSEYGDGEDLGVNISPENGAKEDGDEVFGPKSKTEEAETGSKEQKKHKGSDGKPPSRRESSRSEDEEKGEKEAEEMTPCKSNAGDTKEEEECRGAPEENSPQPPSGNKEEKVCDGPQEEEQQDSACEQEKGDKEKEEAEAKETSESTVTRGTSEETPLAPEPLQDAVGLETASEPSTSAMQDQGTA
ncbi:capZ-interacting protein [Strigops habroptila]|uniref:RCSD domain containing 1 n=1 Tax=Strigops habroptila TaxID=2489341 RepID=A0A672U2L1_STRHB|nr:capZ-interacting protein [Strigops habroptila]